MEFACVLLVVSNKLRGINGPAFKTTLKGGNDRFAWAVHDGRVSSIPVPAAIYLFGSGLVGLVGLFGMMRRKAA